MVLFVASTAYLTYRLAFCSMIRVPGLAAISTVVSWCSIVVAVRYSANSSACSSGMLIEVYLIRGSASWNCSSCPTNGLVDVSNGCLAWMANWLLMPNSMLTASSRAFSVVKVVFKSSFCISRSIMFAVNMSLSSSSSRSASWQCSASDLSAGWNYSIVSPPCCLRVKSRYLLKVSWTDERLF